MINKIIYETITRDTWHRFIDSHKKGREKMKERSLSTFVINEREIGRRTREKPKLFGPRK